MSVSIEVSGIPEALKFLNTKEKDIDKGITAGLSKAAVFIQGEVKSSIAGQRAEPTSVDTGRFLNSVDFMVGNDEAVVFTDIDYAKFLEYGTSKFTARPHFRNTKSRNQDKVKDIIKEEINI